MIRALAIALFVFTCVGQKPILSQETASPARAIGKRVELKVKRINGDGESTFIGIVTQVDQKRLILEEVFKTRFENTGVPFLKNVNYVDKRFKNVGATEKIKLDYGIVLQLDQIKSWRILETKTNNKLKDKKSKDKKSKDKTSE